MTAADTPSGNRTAGIAGPVGERDRILALDVLRGFALLGILVPNIQAYSMVSAAYRNPTAYGDFTGGNFVVWYCTNLLFEQKFMTLFSAMFGAGIVLMTGRVAAADQRPAARHYRRMLWLLLFGIAHAYLLWYGDILFAYGIAGLVVYWLRNWRPARLIAMAFLFLAVGSGISLLSGMSMPYWPAEQIAEFREEWKPSPEVVAHELEVYRGSWLQQMQLRAPTAFFFETFLLLILMFWRAGGLMLMGMALFKLNIINGLRSPSFYATAAVVGLGIGLPLVAIENQINLSRDFALKYSFFFGAQINYWASLLISFGYMSIIMLMCKSGWLSWLRSSLAAVGRMALTNYIAHSVICTTIFYGHGFGYFGYLERTQQLGVVVAIWLLQLIVSPLWLARYRFGPLEWLWRSLVYQQRQPLRRTSIG